MVTLCIPFKAMTLPGHTFKHMPLSSQLNMLPDLFSRLLSFTVDSNRSKHELIIVWLVITDRTYASFSDMLMANSGCLLRNDSHQPDVTPEAVFPDL